MPILTEFHKWQARKGFKYSGIQSNELKLKLYEIYLTSILGEQWKVEKEVNPLSHWGPNRNK